MSIQSAIQALSPLHYWPMATASGDLTMHDIVGTLHFTSDVNDGGGYVGPDGGTTSQRLFSDQVWETPSLNANAWTNQTWLVFVSNPANGGTTTTTPFMGWGDFHNQAARGFRLATSSTGAQSAGLFYMSQAHSSYGGAVSWPQNGWHMIAITIQPPSVNFSVQLDGGALQNIGYTETPPINTDYLWIQSQAPIMIAHLATFNYVATTTQLASVYQQVVNWPLQVPVNMPITVSGGGTTDLTPVLTQTTQILNNQAVYQPVITTQVPEILTNTTTIENQNNTIGGQTTQIQTDTHNIVNSLFPQLADAINAILGAVTATITGVGGAIGQTLGQLFSGRTFDLLTLIHLGSACAPDVINADLTGLIIYGIQMEATTIPDYTTFTGWGEDYTQKSLGTLIIYRGGQIILRRGLHNQTEMVYPLPGVPFFEYEIALPQAPGDYNVVLEPAPGTCWTLSGLSLP